MSQPASPIGSVEFIVKFDSMEGSFIDAMKDAFKDADIEFGADPKLVSKVDEILFSLRNRLRGIWTGDRVQFLETAIPETKQMEKPEVIKGVGSAFVSKKIVERKEEESITEWMERSNKMAKVVLENWKLMIERAMVDKAYWEKNKQRFITWQGGFQAAMANWEHLNVTLFKQIIKEFDMEEVYEKIADKYGHPVFRQTTMSKLKKDIGIRGPAQQIEEGVTTREVKKERKEGGIITRKVVEKTREKDIITTQIIEEIQKEGEEEPERKVLETKELKVIELQQLKIVEPKEVEVLEPKGEVVQPKEVTEVKQKPIIKDVTELVDIMAMRVPPEEFEAAFRLEPKHFKDLSATIKDVLEDISDEYVIAKGTRMPNIFIQYWRELFGDLPKDFPIPRAQGIRTDVSSIITPEEKSQEAFRKTREEAGYSIEKTEKILEVANRVFKKGLKFFYLTEELKTFISRPKKEDLLERYPERTEITDIQAALGLITRPREEFMTLEQKVEVKEKQLREEHQIWLKYTAERLNISIEKLEGLLRKIEEGEGGGGLSKIFSPKK